MSPLKNLFASLLLLSASSSFVMASEEVLDTIQEYLDFAEYAEGSISTEQLASVEDNSIFFVDTRNAGQFREGHIPGAINIEWRSILKRRAEIPKDKPVVLYCETGLLSSKSQFMLKLAGYDNVKVLWGGYMVWTARQSFENAQQVGKPTDK
jgi:rhodanese-related sulfurtransferase